MRDFIGNEAVIVPEDNEVELWATVKDFPNYEVSTFGNIRRVISKRELSKRLDKNGYYTVCLYKLGKAYYKRLSRVVCEAFYEEKDISNLVCDHIDKCRINNYYKNLRWTTPAENNRNRNSFKVQNWNTKHAPVSVLLLDKDNNIVQEFSCALEAVEKTKWGWPDIAANLNGKRLPFRGGLHFVRKKDYIKDLT